MLCVFDYLNVLCSSHKDPNSLVELLQTTAVFVWWVG